MKDKYSIEMLKNAFETAMDEQSKNVRFDQHKRIIDTDLKGSEGNWEYVDKVQTKLTWDDIYRLQTFIFNTGNPYHGCFPNGMLYHIDMDGCEDIGLWDAYIVNTNYDTVVFKGTKEPGIGMCMSKSKKTGSIFSVPVQEIQVTIPKDEQVKVAVEFSNPVGLRFGQLIGLLPE